MKKLSAMANSIKRQCDLINDIVFQKSRELTPGFPLMISPPSTPQKT